MIIENIAKPITLPEDLKKQIEKVQMQLAVNKEEVVILQKTRFSEQGAIEQLVRERQFLTEKKEELQKEIGEQLEKAERLKKIVAEKEKDFTSLSKKLEDAQTVLKLAEGKKTEAETFVDKANKEILAKLNALKDKEREIAEKESQAQHKLAEIKQFLTKFK